MPSVWFSVFVNNLRDSARSAGKAFQEHLESRFNVQCSKGQEILNLISGNLYHTSRGLSSEYYAGQKKEYDYKKFRVGKKY